VSPVVVVAEVFLLAMTTTTMNTTECFHLSWEEEVFVGSLLLLLHDW